MRKEINKEIKKLKKRDSKGNVQHMKAIYNTIRVLGKGDISRSTKLMNAQELQRFEKKVKISEMKGKKKT